MNRRDFHGALLAAAVPAWPGAQTRATAADTSHRLAAIEAASAGRLGVALLDTGSQALQGHRLDERFPLCSTFKWLAAARVLQRVDAGEERLDRVIRFGRDALVPHAPVTAPHAGSTAGLTLAQLCEAAIVESDNTAANLLLQSYGGPAELTRFARAIGDPSTRLDRMEPELNESRPGDPRDTTTPRGMATALRAVVLGDVLTAASRSQLVQWLEAVRTNQRRLRAHLPPGWRLGSKTGTGANGSTHDVGVYWPPGRPPVVVVAYLTETRAPEATRNGTVAQVGRLVTG